MMPRRVPRKVSHNRLSVFQKPRRVWVADNLLGGFQRYIRPSGFQRYIRPAKQSSFHPPFRLGCKISPPPPSPPPKRDPNDWVLEWVPVVWRPVCGCPFADTSCGTISIQLSNKIESSKRELQNI